MTVSPVPEQPMSLLSPQALAGYGTQTYTQRHTHTFKIKQVLFKKFKNMSLLTPQALVVYGTQTQGHTHIHIK